MVVSPESAVAYRYRLVEKIGEGAHGEVWSAVDEAAASRVAIKILHGRGSRPFSDAYREIEVLRRLTTPGVVRLLDEGCFEERLFLVMELVDGAPFPGGGGLAWEAVAPLAKSLLTTLAHVHALGVLHRDLKPANVLAGARGELTILDFSIAEETGRGSSGSPFDGAWRGTPTHLAPEQLLGDPASVRGDLYSVGIMLHGALAAARDESCSGAPLSRRERFLGPPRLPAGADVPPHVGDVVGRLLAPDPADRPRSALATMRALWPED